ncbi:AraC family transcriptional regulator [Burkholderia sp. SRS-46]|nr:AraC family transcriptional regulator [Burkholderia sp. SRS-46]
MANIIDSTAHRTADLSETSDGPLVIGIRGDDSPTNEFRLGTREYDWHHHVRGQLFCVETGLIQVNTSHGSWLLPPYHAGWIPPDVPHEVRVSGAVSGWTLFMAPLFCANLPSNPCVIAISEVLRVLAQRATEWDKRATLTPDQARIATVIQDEIRRAPQEALHVPMPADPRLLRVARAVLADPGNPRTLDEWASFGSMSSRTLRRLTLAETGLSFGQWRQQVKLMHGLDMLARGILVAEVSDVLGYSSPSNFIAMFRKVFGDSPAHYFSTNR